MSADNRFNAGLVNLKSDIRAMVGELQKLRASPIAFTAADRRALDAAQTLGERVVSGLDGLMPLHRSLEWDGQLRGKWPDLSAAELKKIHADIDTVVAGHATADAKADAAAVKKATSALAARGVVVNDVPPDGWVLRVE